MCLPQVLVESTYYSRYNRVQHPARHMFFPHIRIYLFSQTPHRRVNFNINKPLAVWAASVCALDPCDLYLTRLPSLPLRQARMDRLYKQRDFHCRYHSHRHYKCCKRLYMHTCKIMMTLCKKWRYKKERKTKCLFYFFFLACFHTFNAPFCF